jgi:hypothetical protein
MFHSLHVSHMSTNNYVFFCYHKKEKTSTDDIELYTHIYTSLRSVLGARERNRACLCISICRLKQRFGRRPRRQGITMQDTTRCGVCRRRRRNRMQRNHVAGRRTTGPRPGTTTPFCHSLLADLICR